MICKMSKDNKKQLLNINLYIAVIFCKETHTTEWSHSQDSNKPFKAPTYEKWQNFTARFSTRQLTHTHTVNQLTFHSDLRHMTDDCRLLPLSTTNNKCNVNETLTNRQQLSCIYSALASHNKLRLSPEKIEPASRTGDSSQLWTVIMASQLPSASVSWAMKHHY